MRMSRGFTLIEMAIVLVIITILVGGLAMPLAAQIQARRIAETKKTLEEAREAIIGFVMSHTTNSCTCAYTSGVLDGLPNTTCQASLCSAKFDITGTATLTVKPRPYLPCPDTNGDGIEERTGNSGNSCGSGTGWLPWVTLGTAAQDGWGNRLRYSVETSAYSNKLIGMPNPTSSATTLKRVCRTMPCTAVEADNLPVVILSQGPNGWGALNINSSSYTLLLKAPTSADELENTDNNTNFVSRTPTQADNPSGEFDDLVVWISDSVLRSRVCPSGGCP